MADPSTSSGLELAFDDYDEELTDLQSDVIKAFDNKNDQVINLERYWRIYNTELTVNQSYNGNSQIFLPLVRDAIEARVTRFVNMLFPENEQHVEVINYGGELPTELMAMLNHYVKRADLRLIAPPLLRNGEVEGHYSVYVDWATTKRYVTRLVDKPIEIDGVPDYDQTYRDIEEDEVEDAHPSVEVIPAYDLAVYPVTVASIEEAEFVAIQRRYTKAKVKQLQRDGLFDDDEVEMLLKEWTEGESPNYHEDVEKKKIKATGIDRRGNFLICYEVWKKFEVEDDEWRWCRLFMRGFDKPLLGFAVNPNWNDRCPVLSMPRTKIANSFWGKSPVDAVEQLQYSANDAANMAWDSAQYSLLPIVMTDPEKNPNKSTMMLGLAAVWMTNPRDTQILSFPQLWKEALQIITANKSQIMESFGLNPAMMAQGVSAKKPSQAQVAQEQMVAIENTANEVITLEEAIFSPLLQRFFEADQQFRRGPLNVKIYGQLGVAAQMLEIPTFAWDDRYEFRWRGVQAVRSAQATQQMIAGMNVLRSMPPVLPSGKRIELDPILEVFVENTYGPRLASRILVDIRNQLSVDPGIENQVMMAGEAIPVHEFDDDQKHLQSHSQALMLGDPTGLLRSHIQQHLMALQKKQPPPPQPGAAPPGGPPGAGGPPGGPPRPGAQPMLPRGGQSPPGAIHQDQMVDPSRMPRPPGGGMMQ
jgi:hypothetical protein